MRERLRLAVVPVYLFACLILGGSAQGIWQNMILQLCGIGIIAWSATAGGGSLSVSARQLVFLIIAIIAVVALQMMPLPSAVWMHLGPRARLAQDFRLLGTGVPSEPLSLTPAAGLDSLLATIPALAVFSAMIRLRAYRPNWIAMALIAGTLAGVALGAMQVASANPLESPFYLYGETNWGRAVGFFANADHMATLLVVAIPFLAALVPAAKGGSRQSYSAAVAIVGGVALVVIVGLALNGSLAGYALALPVVAASSLIIIRRGSKLRSVIVLLTASLLVGAVAALETTAIGGGKLGEHATSAVQSRSELATTTSHAITDFMPFGAGLGSFRNVYALYENPRYVTDTYVVHAHNDYLELALELGLPGIILIVLFLLWWAAAVWRAWRPANSRAFTRSAAIASAAILAHTAVDFPLRTTAIAACFALCLALLADAPVCPPDEDKQIRRTRHVTI